MVVDKEDLSLSLGLGLNLSFPDNQSRTPPPPQLNLMPMPSFVSSSVPSPSSQFNIPENPSWNQTFPSSDRKTELSRAETRPFLIKDIDVNRFPTMANDTEEEAGVSSPNSTISSASGKRSEREGNVDDHERACSRGISDEDDGDNSRKKLRLSKDQSAVLEESFKEHNTLNPKQKMALAKRLGLRPRQVEVWFQNRRARTKLKQTEVDCEFLKRCYDNLTEENRKLRKETQELRALKLSPQFYMQMTPPTTLTMCPSCERVAVPPSSSSAPISATFVNPRPLPFNPWATTTTPVPHRTFDVLHPRS